MRALVLWFLALSLTVSPALADSGGAKDKAAAAKADAKTAAATKPGEPAKPPTDGTPANPSVEAELQQLKELLQSQATELEAQRAAMHEQQQRMAALESELRLARTSAAVPADPGAAPGAPVNATAQDQEGFAKKIESVENRIKGVGPFSFSGDFRLRDEPFFGGPSNQSQVRNRERFRLRFNVNAKLNDDVSGGFSVASGDINDPISTNQTTNQFYTRKPFLIDKAFINYNPGYAKPLTLTGGKFAYPFYRTELTWDNDLNPEGLAQTLAFNIDTPIFKKFAVVGFELPFTEVAGVSANKSIVQSAVYGGQVQTTWQFTDRVKFGAYAAFYNYHNADPIAFALATANAKNPQSPSNGLLPLGGSSVQNSITTTTQTSVVTVSGSPISTGIKTITNAQFASKFALFDTIARFDFDTGHDRWPLIVQGDFVQNTKACANVGNILPAPAPTSTATFSQSTNAPCDSEARRGYWLEARVGRTWFPGQADKVEKGDWDFAYTRMFIEREAIMGAFNFSDLRQQSNVEQHRVEVFYQAYKNVQFAFTGLFGRPLESSENVLKRLQFDVVYKF